MILQVYEGLLCFQMIGVSLDSHDQTRENVNGTQQTPLSLVQENLKRLG